MVAKVRDGARIADDHPDYTDARIREEITRVLAHSFAVPVMHARAGYWRQKVQTTLAASTRAYRLPHRALLNSADVIEFQSGSKWLPVQPLELRDAGPSSELTGATPTHFLADGDHVEIYPLLTSAQVFRTTYILRPPSLQQFQAAGLVTAVDTGALTVTVNSAPVDRETAAALTGAEEVDIVHPNGGHELALVGVTPSGLGGSVFTFPAGTDLSRVAVGDYVRAADQTDWPMLHAEFHGTLADATAAALCVDLGKALKAQQLVGKVESELNKMVAGQEPRIKHMLQKLKRRHGAARRRTRYGSRFPLAPGGT